MSTVQNDWISHTHVTYPSCLTHGYVEREREKEREREREREMVIYSLSIF
jgi:hypothetical protein